MADKNILGIDVTEVSDIARHTPGAQIEKGGTIYMYCKAGAATVSANIWYPFKIASSGVPTVAFTNGLRTAALMSIAYPVIIGVYHGAPEAITSVPANYYFWAAIKGRIRGYTAAAVAVDAKIYTSGTTGTVDDVSTSQDLLPGLVCYTAATGSQVTDFYAHQEIVLNGY